MLVGPRAGSDKPFYFYPAVKVVSRIVAAIGYISHPSCSCGISRASRAGATGLRTIESPLPTWRRKSSCALSVTCTTIAAIAASPRGYM